MYACMRMIKESKTYSNCLGIKAIDSEVIYFPVLAYWIEVFKTIGFDILFHDNNYDQL